MNTRPSDTGLPDPTVSNLKKATPEELAQEVINLRLYVGSLLLEMREFMALLTDITGNGPSRITDLETAFVPLKLRVERLEGKVDTQAKTIEAVDRKVGRFP